MSAIHKRAPLQLATSRPPQSTSCDWSQHHILTLRKSIDNNSSNNLIARQELKLQRQTSTQFLSHVRSTMISTEQSGIQLATKYEEEKCKHYYQQQIENEKRQEHQRLINKEQNSEYDQLNLQTKQSQKTLEQVTNKLNSFQSETISSYEIIKSERRERTVFSNLFNKFQNELFSLDQKYKQFVIERTLLQKNFEFHKQEFIKIQNEKGKKMQAREKGIHEFKERESEFREQKEQRWKESCHESRIQIKVGGLSCKVLSFADECKRSREDCKRSRWQDEGLAIEPSLIRSRSRLNISKGQKNETVSRQQMWQMNEKKWLNMEHKKKIQWIMNEMGLQSVKQLRSIISILEFVSYEEYVEEVEEINDGKREEIKKVEDATSEWEGKINELKKTISAMPLKHKRTHSEVRRLKQRKELKRIVGKATINAKDIQEQIKNFNESSELRALLQTLDLPVVEPQSQIQIDPSLMSAIQSQLSALMSHPNSRPKPKPRLSSRHRKSLMLENVAVHPPNSKESRLKESLIHTQRTICPLLESPVKKRHSKRIKTSVCPSSDFQPIKKLSNLLRNQSRFKGPVDVASKEQLISEATEAFGKEGIFRRDKFYVNYY